MTVLLLAPERDISADRMVRVLERRGVPVVRFDTAWFPERASVDAELRNGQWVGSLSVGTRNVELQSLRSIWYRNPSAFRFPDGLSATERQWAMNEAKLGLGGVLFALPVLWLNYPERAVDCYKPVQLVTAARCGLRVPDTLVTNRADAVRRFAGQSETVVKALGAAALVEDGVRKTMFTYRLDAEDLTDLRGVEVTAHQFQRWVPKACEARLFVMGERVFAAGIHARNDAAYVDWRNDYSALYYERLEPPSYVVAGVLEYCIEFGLLYGAFDFVIRPDGEWVFLECNSGGQFGWIERAISAPITTSLADLLQEGTSGARY